MSNTSNVAVRAAFESSYGVIPTTPTLKTKRITADASLAQKTTYSQSQELIADEQVAGNIRTDVSTAGGWPFELSYGSHDDELLAISKQASGWAAAVTAANATAHAITGGGTTLHRSSGSYITDGFLAGKWIKVSGFTGNAANALFWAKITAVTASDLSILPMSAIVDDAEGESVTIKQGEYLENGTTFRSMYVEKEFTDLTSGTPTAAFAQFLGQVLDSMSLSVSAQQIVTGQWGFLGKKEQSASATVAGSTTAAGTTLPFNAIDHVVAFLEGGTTLALKDFTWELKRNHRIRNAIGVLGAQSIGSGTIGLGGKFTAYYDSVAQYAKYLNATETSIAFMFKDAAGNALLFEAPRVNFSNAQRVGGGQNTDVLASMDWVASRHQTEGKTFRFVRWPAS